MAAFFAFFARFRPILIAAASWYACAQSKAIHPARVLSRTRLTWSNLAWREPSAQLWSADPVDDPEIPDPRHQFGCGAAGISRLGHIRQDPGRAPGSELMGTPAGSEPVAHAARTCTNVSNVIGEVSGAP